MYYNQNAYNQQGLFGQMYSPYVQAPTQPMMATQQQPQNNTLPLLLVNGIDEARRYLVNINSTIYLRDTNSNLIFEKTCDSQGRTIMRTFEMKEVNINEQNQVVDKPQVAYKKDLDELYSKIEALLTASKSDLKGDTTNV